MAKGKVTIAQYDYPRNADKSIRMIEVLGPNGRPIDGQAKYPPMDRVNDGKKRGFQVGEIRDAKGIITGYKHNVVVTLGEPADLEDELVTEITTGDSFRGECGAPHYRKV